MGFGDWVSDRWDDAKDTVNDVADDVEEALDDGAEWLGEQVDAGSEHLADAMDHVGWESGADWVRDRGDDAADFLGAEVAEMELGESEDPKDLVHGEVERISELSTRLSTFSGHMADASAGLGAITAAGWEGTASEGFDAKLRAQPPKWDAASTACASASTAISDFSQAVTRAQGRAQVAIDTWKEAEQTSRDAVDDYNDRVDDYNAKRDLPEGERPERPGPFVDPGDAGRQRAREILDDARRNRDEAGETAASAVRTATEEAPEEPEFTEEVAGTLSDLDQMGDIWGAHLTMGALKGVTGLVALVRTVNPTDPWNMRNPAAYMENVSNLANGLVHLANDPLGTLGTMFSKFTTDPAEALGELIPELIGGKGLGRVGSLNRLDGLADDVARLGDDVPRVGDDLPRRDVPTPHDIHFYDDVSPPPPGSASAAELDAWVDEVVQAHPHLDPEGIRGVYEYTTNQGYSMNSELRAGSVGPGNQIRVDAANAGIDQLPTYDGVTYRGSNLPQHVVDDMIATGRYSDNAFSSSSLDPDIAREPQFLNPSGENPTFFTIQGESGVNVTPFSAHQREVEILFRNGAEFDVVSNHVDADGIRHVTLQER